MYLIDIKYYYYYPYIHVLVLHTQHVQYMYTYGTCAPVPVYYIPVHVYTYTCVRSTYMTCTPVRTTGTIPALLSRKIRGRTGFKNMLLNRTFHLRRYNFVFQVCILCWEFVCWIHIPFPSLRLLLGGGAGTVRAHLYDAVGHLFCTQQQVANGRL